MAGCILFIDDDETGREAAAFALRKAGYEVDVAADGGKGVARFDATRHALVFTDVRMPGIGGMQVLAEVRGKAPEVPVVVITAFPDVDLAVRAMKEGAADFVTKPFSNEHLLLVAARTLERRALVEENRKLRREAAGIERPIVYRSAVMAQILSMADRVAASDATVLLSGESGTGKELVARRIHARSARADKPFVTVNCAAIPKDLVEDELFGHDKGAFTGAERARTGRMRQADGGTLFLDEIGELPLSAQARLLRVLQEGTVDVVGRDEPVRVDLRFVAAGNRDLRPEADAGRFRADLYYRLAVVEIRVPPLRERPEDIPELVGRFVIEAARGREVDVPDELMAELVRRPWPGNVRELRNVCERLVLLASEARLDMADLPPLPGSGAWLDGAGPLHGSASAGGPSGAGVLTLPPEGVALFDVERQVIEQALAMNQWNVSRTAAFLKVPRHILAYRIERHGLVRPS